MQSAPFTMHFLTKKNNETNDYAYAKRHMRNLSFREGMKMKKACVFDLDGTLVDTLTTISYFANRALSSYGYPEIPKERYKVLVGNGAKVLVERMLREAGAPMEAYGEVSALYNGSYDDNPLYLSTPYEGIRELLKALREKGLKLGVLTNKPDSTAQQVISGLFGEGVFDRVIGKSDAFPKKPAPAALLNMLGDWGIEPSECLYIGDSGVDMETGNRAGAETVGVLWGFREKEELLQHGAHHLAEVPGEILSFL